MTGSKFSAEAHPSLPPVVLSTRLTPYEESDRSNRSIHYPDQKRQST